MKVSELIAILQVAKSDAEVRIMQPRHWVKRQPDMTPTRLLKVSVWHDGSIVQFDTMGG